MISASKYQHIITFMSLLKVSLCVNGPNQKTIVHGHTQGEKQKHFFSLYGEPFCSYFSIWRALCYVFLLMRDFFHCMEAFLLLFLYVGGFFATSSSWCGAFFTMWGPFLLIFSPCGGTFLSS